MDTISFSKDASMIAMKNEIITISPHMQVDWGSPQIFQE
jgi:hypothetical protein